MAKPERMEDIGRLRERLNHILNEEWPHEESPRIKDYIDWFFDRSQGEQDEKLRGILWFMNNLKDELYELLEIARGDEEECP